MIVSLGPIDFDDDFRRALRSYRGKVGLATRKEIRSWIDGLINAGAENVMYDFRSEQDREEEPRPEVANF